MTKSLFISAIAKVTLGILLVGVLVFWPAGTLAYPSGWIFMGVLFIPMLAGGFFLMAKNPELLKKRLNAKEKLGSQGLVVKLSGLMFIAGFVVAGLDYRYSWYPMPLGVVIAAAGVMLLGYLLYAEVLRENTYLSRTIEVQEGQRVIDSGLYGIVRHPMYSATLLLFLAMPLALGSLIALPIFLLYIPIIVARLLGEEKLLEAELPGYREYKQRVRWRLIPFVF